jgi:hypothetical protein
MANTYTVTANVKCWKKHECVGCGCVYRYLFKRTVQGSGGSERQAHKNAEKNVVKALENEVDVRPCPTCGRVQPDMVGQVKAGRHALVAWGSLLLLALFVILGAAHALTYTAAGLASAAVALVAAGVHVAVALPDPNADTDRNKNQAERFVDDGTLEVTTRGKEDGSDPPPKPTGLAHWLGILAVGWSAVVLLAPVIAKSAARWPTNPEYVPEVVGPGDEFKMRFAESIEAVKGYWSGQPTVLVLNPEEVGNTPVRGTGSNTTWGDTISGKSVSNRTTTPYAHIQVPNDPRLVGKSLRLRVTMNVSYPQKSGNSFENQRTTVARDIQVTLAAAGAGAHYTRTFWLGSVVGALLCVCGGFYLRSLGKELRKHANPADVESVKDDDEDDEGEDDRPRRRRDDDEDRPRRRRRRDDDD